MHTEILNWTISSRVLEKISIIYLKLGFSKLHRMLDTHSRMLFSHFSHSFVTTNVRCDLFEDILARIDKAKEENDRIVCNENIV